MKHVKRIMAILMVVVMALMMFPMAVSAAEHLDTSKKVSFDVICAKPGYTFTVYKVGTLDTTYTSPYETKYTSLVDAIDDAVLNGKTADALAALDALATMPAEAPVVGTFTTSASTTTKDFENLAQGIYYIKATNYPAGVTSVTNSLVALPYYDGTNWIYDIENIQLGAKVVDKDVTTEKTITNSTKGNVNYTDVSLGDTVEFEIRSTTTGSTSMKLNSYVVYDEMSKGLTLNEDSFKVALLKADGTKITDLAANEYTMTVTSKGAGKPTLFEVALDDAYLQTDEFYGADVYYTSITYSAVLNADALIGNDENQETHLKANPNTDVKLEYSNKNGVTSEVEGNTVYVYTYAIDANKYDEKGNALQGSEFELYATSADAQNMVNPIAKGTSDVDGLVKFYALDADGNKTTNEISLQSGTYYAVETKAPAGYNVYGNVITIDATATYSETFVNGSWIKTCPENGTAHFDIYNTRLMTYVTGGEGRTNTFFIGGAIAVIGLAFVAVYMCKKRKVND